MSRFIILIVIMLIFIGGYILVQNSTGNQHIRLDTPSVSVSPGAGIRKTESMAAAEQYFSEVTKCLENPPEEAAGQKYVYCHTHNAFAGKNIENNLKEPYASVFCSQNTPLKVTSIRSTEINPNQALVVVREEFGTGKIDATFQMERENEVWKVVNVLCPIP